MTQHPASEDRAAGLAVRYRPRRFVDLVGQRHVTAVLRRLLDAARVPQQLLFTGSSGLGKTTVARVLAAALLCERGGDDACGACSACDDVTGPRATHPDVVELDAASHGSKDDVLALAERAALAPARGRRKIYIIDEAHGLSAAGGQAFLKLLEEPPPHVTFMLASTDPQRIAEANRGRCTEFELLRPTDDELAANLTRVAAGEGWSLDDRTARAVVAATDPALGVRGTLNTLAKLADLLAAGEADDEGVAALLGTPPQRLLDDLTAAIDAGERDRAIAALDALRDRASDQAARRALLRQLRSRLRDAAARGDTAGVDSASDALEIALSASPGTEWTDLLVARLAAARGGPPSATSPTEARDGASTATATDARDPAASEPHPPPASGDADQSPSHDPGDAQPDDSSAAPPAADAAAPPPAASDDDPSRGDTPAERPRRDDDAADLEGGDSELAALLADVEGADRAAAAMLRAADLRVEGRQLRIRAAAPLLARMRQRPHGHAIAEAAARHNLAVSAEETGQ